METKIVGTTMPVLEVNLQPNESIVSSAGEMSWMTSSIEMHTTSQSAGASGVFGAFKRAAGGGTFFMTEFTANGSPGMVAFATKVPGHIRPLEVTSGQTYMVHKHGFLCATDGVELSVGFQQKLGAGVFGGAGFRLQKLSGNCQAWIELDGEVMEYDLQSGETLRVHPGHVGLFQEQVRFDITRIKGVKNMLFGGEAIFLAELTGPGKIWLQSLPLANLAHELQEYMTVQTGEAAAAGGVAGAVLKGFSSK